MLKRAVVTAIVAVAAVSAHADVVLLAEGFDGVPTSSGWVLLNQSSPVGTTGWYQGDSGQFTSQAGADDAYVAANYNNSALGGTISNWLITPSFSTALAGTVSFWARGVGDPAFPDALAFGLNGSASSDTASFTLGSSFTAPSEWTRYSVNYEAQGAGSVARFAIHYNGAADLSNYVGVDTLTVTAVPEPTTWVLMAAGLLALGVAKRRAGAAATRD